MAKISKIGEVKGIKGFIKLFEEIAVTAKTDKDNYNELIGCCNIPLRVY